MKQPARRAAPDRRFIVASSAKATVMEKPGMIKMIPDKMVMKGFCCGNTQHRL